MATAINCSNLTILNWNANGLKRQENLLLNFLSRHKIDIACITETHLLPPVKFRAAGYFMYREDQNARTGGVAILIRRHIKHEEIILPRLVNLEAVGIRLNLQNGSSIKIISAYNKPGIRLLQADLHNIFTGESTLLFGDLNSKHTLFGCRGQNSNGTRLLSFADSLGLLISTPDEPTFYPTQQHYRPDILDFAVIQNFHLPLFHKTITDLDSDHLPTLCTFREKTDIFLPVRRLLTGKVNWDKFKLIMQSVTNIPLTYSTTHDIDIAIQSLTENICTAIQNSTQHQQHQHSTPITSPEILCMIQQKNTLRKRWQRTRDPDIKQTVNRLSRNIRLKLDEERIERYRNYIGNMFPGDSSLWRETKRLLRQTTTIPPLNNGHMLVSSDEEKVELFASHLETVFQPLQQNDHETNAEVHASLNEARLTNSDILFISPSEVSKTIANLPNKKAPGEDLVPNIVIKKLPKKCVVLLTSIFNACLRRGYFPKNWKNAIVIFFPKPNKPKQDPQSYRPISLLNTMSKILEKHIEKRLRQHLSDKLPLHQFGFKENHSAVQQLQRVSEFINRGFERKLFTAGLFLDISQAFDKVWHEGLLHKLRKTNPPMYLYSILASFIDQRSFQVRVNSTLSSKRKILAGVPQGAILSPLLFLLYVSDMPSPEMTATFADDTLLMAQHKSIDNAIRLLQRAADEVTQWIFRWRLKINVSKTEAKIFSLRRFQNENLHQLNINRSSVHWKPPNEAVRYLGLQFDTKLTWKQHIYSTLQRANLRFRLLYPLMNRHTPLQHTCISLLYKAFIRPIIAYAAPVWFCASNSNKSKLEAFQSKILRMSTNTPWFVRNNQIRRELNITTFHDFIISSTEKYHANLRHSSGAVHYQLGARRPRRLRPRHYQDILNI